MLHVPSRTYSPLIPITKEHHSEQILDIHKAFRHGAEKLAADQCKYTALHQGHGIDPFSWEVLTKKEYWSPDEARDMRSVLANVIEVSLTIAGMPAIPLPGQYVAALIAIVVAPANRLLACTKAPDTFDAFAASGLMETHEVKTMPVQQLMALVVLYSAETYAEPPPHKLPRNVGEAMEKHSKK